MQQGGNGVWHAGKWHARNQVEGNGEGGRNQGREVGGKRARLSWREWWGDVLAGNIVTIPAEHFQTRISRV